MLIKSDELELFVDDIIFWYEEWITTEIQAIRETENLFWGDWRRVRS